MNLSEGETHSMSDTLYIQTDRNMKVTKETVTLGEIADLSCRSTSVLARNQARPIARLPKEKYGRYVVSMIDIIRQIEKAEPQVEICHIGEPTFILTYENPTGKNRAAEFLKLLFVSLVTFFGAGFSIMTFNTDADVRSLFDNIYQTFTGSPSPGFSVLEISYSLGIGIGVILFFNHFGRRKLTQDPTPMEVEMRTYEDDIDSTIIEQSDRKQAGGGHESL